MVLFVAIFITSLLLYKNNEKRAFKYLSCLWWNNLQNVGYLYTQSFVIILPFTHQWILWTRFRTTSSSKNQFLVEKDWFVVLTIIKSEFSWLKPLSSACVKSDSEAVFEDPRPTQLVNCALHNSVANCVNIKI